MTLRIYIPAENRNKTFIALNLRENLEYLECITAPLFHQKNDLVFFSVKSREYNFKINFLRKQKYNLHSHQHISRL